MLNISPEAIQMIADTCATTFANIATILAYIMAMPLAFYVFKRLIGLIPR
jgi:hypothetical protein